MQTNMQKEIVRQMETSYLKARMVTLGITGILQKIQEQTALHSDNSQLNAKGMSEALETFRKGEITLDECLSKCYELTGEEIFKKISTADENEVLKDATLQNYFCWILSSNPLKNPVEELGDFENTIIKEAPFNGTPIHKEAFEVQEVHGDPFKGEAPYAHYFFNFASPKTEGGWQIGLRYSTNTKINDTENIYVVFDIPVLDYSATEIEIRLILPNKELAYLQRFVPLYKVELLAKESVDYEMCLYERPNQDEQDKDIANDENAARIVFSKADISNFKKFLRAFLGALYGNDTNVKCLQEISTDKAYERDEGGDSAEQQDSDSCFLVFVLVAIVIAFVLLCSITLFL